MPNSEKTKNLINYMSSLTYATPLTKINNKYYATC